MPHPYDEWHKASRIGWLRAAVLGANDGVISTASLMVGVAATGATTSAVLTAGVAGLAAGAMSMAAGEYVSVQSQADTERADIARETRELATQPDLERSELQAIYLDSALASQVAEQLMAHDALGAHVRDELGITETLRARPVGGTRLRSLVRRWRRPAHRRGVAGRRARGRGHHVGHADRAACTRQPCRLRGRRTDCGGRGARRILGCLAMALTAGVGRLFGPSL